MTRRTIPSATLLFGLLYMPISKLVAQQNQYMAICTETQEHGGNEYALTAWLDSLDSANAAFNGFRRQVRGD